MNENDPVLRIVLSKLDPKGTILAGATHGRHHADAILKAARDEGLPVLAVTLDFSKVESISASYLKELLKVFDVQTSIEPQLYPLITNIVSDDVKFELESFLSSKDRALRLISPEQDGADAMPMIGKLEHSAIEAYRQLNARGPSTAAELHERNPDKASNQTAWNNRLVKLFELRLAHRERAGRNWIYKSTVNL